MRFLKVYWKNKNNIYFVAIFPKYDFVFILSCKMSLFYGSTVLTSIRHVASVVITMEHQEMTSLNQMALWWQMSMTLQTAGRLRTMKMTGELYASIWDFALNSLWSSLLKKNPCVEQTLQCLTLLKCVLMKQNIVFSHFVLVLSSCIPGSGGDKDCDPNLEAEVVKPEKCGKITDKNGPFR